MNCKLLASELLCAALLLGCSTAPKLTLPSGDWEEVSQPGATLFSASNSVAVASSTAPPLAPGQTAPGHTAKPPGSPAPGAVASKPPGGQDPKTLPAVPVGASTAGQKAATPTVAAPKDFSAPPQAPVVAVAATSPKVVVPPPKTVTPPKPVWTATVGQSLRAVIKSWSDRANYTLDWRAETLDYPIDAPLRFEGTYEEAVSNIFELYDQADRSFKVDGRPPQHRLTVSEDHDKQKRASQ